MGTPNKSICSHLRLLSLHQGLLHCERHFDQVFCKIEILTKKDDHHGMASEERVRAPVAQVADSIDFNLGLLPLLTQE